MNKKEKAAGDVCGIVDGGEDLYTENYSRDPHPGQFPIADRLPVGEENAISTRELVEAVGYHDARSLQEAIRAERERGALILSRSRGGYFRPSDGAQGREELERYIATLDRRARSTMFTLKTARAALRVVDGQERIV